jgi:hypothetical protein
MSMSSGYSPNDVFGLDRLQEFGHYCATDPDAQAHLANGGGIILEAADGGGAFLEAALVDGALTYRGGVARLLSNRQSLELGI